MVTIVRSQEEFRFRQAAVALIIFISMCFCAEGGWVDPDTPNHYHTTEPLSAGDKREFRLVCSLASRRLLCNQRGTKMRPCYPASIKTEYTGTHFILGAFYRCSPTSLSKTDDYLTTATILDGPLSTRTIVST
jgi:hypothetical protein